LFSADSRIACDKKYNALPNLIFLSAERQNIDSSIRINEVSKVLDKLIAG